MGDEEVVLENDVKRFLTTLSSSENALREHPVEGTLFSVQTLSQIIPSDNTKIVLPGPDVRLNAAFYAGIHDLVSHAQQSFGASKLADMEFQYFPPARVQTRSISTKERAERQIDRANVIASVESSQFANTAYYMGSKRAILGFIVEAMSHLLPESGVVIDLMCGSGAASSGFCRYWPTVASDLQEFCTCLAKVQGGGFDRKRAKTVIGQIIPHAQRHVSDIMSLVGSYIEQEDAFFHSDITPELVADYQEFHKDVPTYPNMKKPLKQWDPIAEVEERKTNNKLYPYCLFTSYFANMYLGVRQCTEVDSLRYAIDQLDDDCDRNWALGALVATVSSLATAYAGHFAQPPIASLDKLTAHKVARLLEKRAYPITQEFCIRFSALAEESENAKHPIQTVAGPWENALMSCQDLLEKQQHVVVYLDAPYKREEYSRYYHVLETLVRYNYPACVGKGKIPDKRIGERLRSEFFTRNQSRMESALVKVISKTLERGWECLWSYADSGDANIAGVIDEVIRCCDCGIQSYVAPHQHKSQGGRMPKEVLEYAVFFTKK
jgi:hypothetical protein